MLSHSRTSLILGGVVAARIDLGLSTVSITALAVAMRYIRFSWVICILFSIYGLY